MVKPRRPQRPWDIDDLLDIGRRWDKRHIKAVPVLILEEWVQGERKEGAANYLRTSKMARRLVDSKLVDGFKVKGTGVVLGSLTRKQGAQNLTDPPLITYNEVWKNFEVNLPHYEPLLQEYRQIYRERYPEDYKKLFPEGEPDWEPPSPVEPPVEGKEARPILPKPQKREEMHSLLAPLNQALREREQTIERLTEENQRLEAEMAALQALEGRTADERVVFVHTSPDFFHSVYGQKVTSIKDTVKAMLQKAEHSIRVSTLQIDIFADDLINLKRRKPNLEITVLTRVKAQGDRSGIATRAVPRMEKADIKVHRDQELLHSRMLVVDDQEVLVPSADLDVTQMELEFNAGIWTNNSDVVNGAIRYFDNILSARR